MKLLACAFFQQLSLKLDMFDLYTPTWLRLLALPLVILYWYFILMLKNQRGKVIWMKSRERKELEENLK